MLLHGLYAITDTETVDSKTLIQQVHLALQGGASIIQYRDKSQNSEKRLFEADQIQSLCEQFAKPLIINDDIQLALQCGAAGVHLGKDDSSLSEARQRLGRKKIIGVSCYNQLSHAMAAQAQGADYIAFGSFYRSSSKPNAVNADINLLKHAKTQLTIPICAIGGITAANGKALLEAGADMLAVIADIFHQDDIEQASKRLAALF